MFPIFYYLTDVFTSKGNILKSEMSLCIRIVIAFSSTQEIRLDGDFTATKYVLNYTAYTVYTFLMQHAYTHRAYYKTTIILTIC